MSNWSKPFKENIINKNDETHIVCVIDKSGSMASKESDVIGGFNKFLSEQKKLEGKAYLTMIQFDNNYEVKTRRTDINHVAELTTKTYIPAGGTALLDSLGRAINEAGDDKKVIVLVITDGEENASKEFNGARIKSLVETKTGAGWSFIYLGAGINSFADAGAMGFNINNTVNYVGSNIGTRAAYATLSASASSYRSTGKAVMDSAQLNNIYTETLAKEEKAAEASGS